MSGGDSTGGGGGSTGEVLDCSKLFERTVLNSPKAEILAKLEAGQVLKLILMQSDSKKVWLLSPLKERLPAQSRQPLSVRLKNV